MFLRQININQKFAFLKDISKISKLLFSLYSIIVQLMTKKWQNIGYFLKKHNFSLQKVSFRL